LMNSESIPQDIKAKSQWVLWNSEARKQRDGTEKVTKVPIQPNGRHASSTDPKTWCIFEKAEEACKMHVGRGIGFVFTRKAGYTGIDLDHCRDPSTGKIDAWAVAHLKRLVSYSEVSPSGEGVHIIVKGLLPDGVDGRKKGLTGQGFRPDAAIEMYSAGRFFTVTQ
jgi:putative DNA primase/helicase